MGSSGAGKTTLLNIISCRIQSNKGGKIFANNFEYTYDSFGKFANYVMQKDLLLQTLTVR
jgi:ABC-type multidrug transport system ATPase subunit